MSTDNKSLKFIHLASNSDASTGIGSYDPGSIIFEPKSGRIAVKNNSGLEYYGGNIKSASFDDKTKILTISFNDGITPAITLDFSDTASAEGVNKVLSGLRGDINDLKTTVNGAKGVVGLVTKVQTNTNDISQNKLDIAANKADIDAIKNESTGILAQAEAYTDTKVGELKTTVDSNSGKITTLERLHADKSDNSGKMKVIDEINAKVGDITGTVKDYVDTAVKTVTDNATDLSGRVTTLEGTVGSKDSGLVKDVTDLAGLHADEVDSQGDKTGKKMTVAAEVAAGIATVVAGAPDRLNTLKEIADWIGSDTTGATQMATDINDLKKKVGASTDTASETGSVYARIAKNVADITDLKTRHSGNLTVAEEVTAGIGAIAADSRTGNDGNVSVTVSTAAGSISGVTVNADVLAGKVTANTNKITALEGVVGSSASGLVKDVADNKAAIADNKSAISTNTTSINGHTTRIEALEGLHGKNADRSLMKVADEADARIAAIGPVTKTNDEGDPKTADVVVTVTTAAGSVSGVTVDAGVLAGKVTANTNDITAEVTRAKKAEGDLRNDLGEKTAVAGTDTAFARIAALEKKQTDGALMWSSWAD